MNAISRVFGTPIALRRLALASLVANVAIVVTGGAVRLTGSGLGCPTWPRCDGSSYVTTPAMGYHGVIEFTNRTLTSVVGTLAVLCVLAALLSSDRVSSDRASTVQAQARAYRIRWAVLVLLGIPAQAILGGITVLTHLNPWVVASHFLLSIAVIGAAYRLWIGTRKAPTGSEHTGPAIRALAWVIVAVTTAVLIAGTVVTGSGPHAGDEHAKRTGLDPATVAQLHTDLVMLLIGLSVAAWFALRATGAAQSVVRAAIALIGIECAQALIGFVQYFTKLPDILVGAHMLGACLVWLGALGLLTATYPPVIPPAAELPDGRGRDIAVPVTAGPTPGLPSTVGQGSFDG